MDDFVSLVRRSLDDGQEAIEQLGMDMDDACALLCGRLEDAEATIKRLTGVLDCVRVVDRIQAEQDWARQTEPFDVEDAESE